MEAYSKRFFEQVHAQVRDSAREIVPLVVDLLNPARVVDVGCGTGTWLATFAEHGAAILGLDGEYVDRSLLDIPEDRFVAVDLAQPFQLDGRYDLALCLEVAEHLPADRAASLVDLLTGLAPTVLFSAAIPLQGGVNHVNEQWPVLGGAFPTPGLRSDRLLQAEGLAEPESRVVLRPEHPAVCRRVLRRPASPARTRAGQHQREPTVAGSPLVLRDAGLGRA